MILKQRRKIKKRQEPWTVNILAELAGRIVFNDKKYIRKTMESTIRERQYLYENLKSLKWLKVYKPEANFILVKILNNLTSTQIQSELIKNRILIRDAANFKFLDSRFIRLAVKDRKSNRLLIKQLAKLA